MAGYAILMIGPEEAHLLNLSIASGWQRRGYASFLLRHLLGVARGHGAKSVFLEVRPSNLAARALYAGFGFSEVGRRRGYYPARGGREDAIVLALPL
jgi:ribosomal-protein-alanine N-acetyltransferase